MSALMQPTGNEVSREGLDDVRRSGRSGSQQQVILLQLYWLAEDQGYTRHELAERTGLALSSVCGRCSELLDVQLLEVVGTRGTPSRQVLALSENGCAEVAAYVKSRGGRGDE
ncbi:hypothetical protein [Halomonas borealis]|uniref:hypothetical protein n=1 Tax=Halomonas borealis TaxID=2508710 RepID=UPI00109FA6A7|nr:hypothetical protein [Halomonas borealis]